MKALFLTLGIIFMSALASMIIAQVPPPPQPDIVPIDGGLSLIIAMGAGYGARSIYKNRNTKEVSSEKE